jgi:cell division protein FtsB
MALMNVIDDMRGALDRGTRQILGPLIGASIVAYFAYYAIEGDRGLIALRQLHQQVGRAQSVLDGMRAQRLYLEHRAALLRPERLDADMLDEQARATLNDSSPDDIVIFLSSRPALPPVVASLAGR